MPYTILIVKESKSDEQRVSLIPKDVAHLVQQGHRVIVESGAGLLSGFSDNDYEQAGAQVKQTSDNLFDDVQIIVRAKRPNRKREIAEIKAFKAGMIMVGALDPYEKNSSHVEEYKNAGIEAYSIDQLEVPAENPMNILANMSIIAGKLAVQDAMQKSKQDPVSNCVIIGTGTAGLAAIDEALAQHLVITVITTNKKIAETLQKKGINAVVNPRDIPLTQQQALVAHILKKAHIVITCARRAKQAAPLLIPTSTLNTMQPGACIVDLAISEGGNVEGSKHDKTLILGNQVIVTNVSGYPKSQPALASEKWSKATLAFILLLTKNKDCSLVQSVNITA